MKRERVKVHKRKKTPLNMKLFYIVILALITTSFSMARYKTSVAGNVNGTTAKWSFKINQDKTENFKINLAQTAQNTTLYNKVDGVIAPGAKGNFIIELDATSTQTAFEYVIKLSTNSNSTMPKEFIFYDPTNQNLPVINTPYPDGSWPEEEKCIKGTKSIEEIKNNPKITYDVSWMWQVNEDRDESNFEGKEFYIDATITTKQIYN